MDSAVTSGERLFTLRQQLKGLSQSATEHFCKLGEIMKEIHDNELWKGEYASFEAFYSDPEFSFKKSSVYHAIKMVTVFPKWQELVDVPVSKLIMVAPYLTEENQSELISQARSLSSSDLYMELSTWGSQVSNPSLPKIYQCKDCHKAKGINFDDLCHCGWNFKQTKIISEAIDKIERTI
ncbi:MAG TPA: hypothetical protein VFF49_04540 [Thermodesulfobacteriota bacterium]|nr:hypothetical protein [Thermodesulfobacteriota bacterium]